MRATLLAAAAAFLVPVAAVAQDAPQQDHERLVQKVQSILNARGFDAGPVNGLNMGKTQAALAQFQRSESLPASGQLDAQTLLQLGVEFDEPASTGSSTGSSTTPESPAPAASAPSVAPQQQ